MFGIADYGAFVAAIVLFLLIPGPGNLALITSTSKGGIRGGLAATLGVIAGDQVLMWAAVAGVATLLATYPAAFNAVQWLGAAYLAGLASGVYASTAELSDLWRAERRFVPTLPRAQAQTLMARWEHAVAQAVLGDPGRGLLWFQLYWQGGREKSLALVKLAEQQNFTAIVITVDSPHTGIRDRERRVFFQLPAGMQHPPLLVERRHRLGA